MVADDHDLQVLDLIERLLRDLKEKVNHNYEVQTRKSKGSKKRKKNPKEWNTASHCSFPAPPEPRHVGQDLFFLLLILPLVLRS